MASDFLTVQHCCGWLAEFAPLKLAEEWDNVGLLVGDRKRPVHRVMTCLTITQSVVDEALAESVDLIVTHHPLPFKPLNRLTTDNTVGRLLLALVEGRVAVYSAHTAFDSAVAGINVLWGERLRLTRLRPLVERAEPTVNASRLGGASGENTLGTDAEVLGSGRYGELSELQTLKNLSRGVGDCVGQSWVQVVGDDAHEVKRVGIACGSGGSFLAAAARVGCQALVTGEATFHTCLEAQSLGIGLILVGHYASERFAMEILAKQLVAASPNLAVWASRREADPIRLVPVFD